MNPNYILIDQPETPNGGEQVTDNKEPA